MTNANSAIDKAVERVIGDFQKYPGCYFVEEDVRWRLMKEIEDALVALDIKHVKLMDGVTSLVHGEYPTPFRCSMGNRSFELQPPESKERRGHFDIVVLNPEAASEYEFKVIRLQDYQLFRSKLQASSLPLLDCVIEIKLFRDLTHPERAESINHQTEYAVQAVKKIAATLEVQPAYYPHKPFAKRGVVLLFDNSDLVGDADDVDLARNHFLKVFEDAMKTIWDSVPETLLCVWATPCPMQKREDYRGRKRLVY
ncbi:MAG: hypothetical protein FJ012_01830 [Chloroflexi bacterium]|nr:hypothetical protein [Chloroflexota bacterium]